MQTDFSQINRLRWLVVISVLCCGCFLNVSPGYSQGQPQPTLEEEVKQKEIQLIRIYRYVVESYQKQLGYQIPKNVSQNMASLSLGLTDPVFEFYFRKIRKIDDLKLYDKVENQTEPKIYSSAYIKSIYQEGLDLAYKQADIRLFYKVKSITDRKIYALNTGKSNSTILEIGGGYRDVAMDMFNQYRGIQFYESEIDQSAVKLMVEFYQNKPYLDEKGNTFYAVNSSEKSTQLEGKKFDYIIIVSTFHHFRFPDEMLESIKKSCHTDTRVMVYEEFKPSFNPFVRYCKDVMEKEDVLALFKKHGFELKEEKKTSSTTRYFRFESSQ